MKITNVSRDYITKLLETSSKNNIVFEDDIWIISINGSAGVFDNSNEDGTQKTPITEEYLEKTLVLNFDDVEPEFIEQTGITEYRLFSEEDAEKIKSFVEKVNECGGHLFVHCTAGISRSSAISISLDEYINKSYSLNASKIWFQYHPNPNLHVLKTMRKILGTELYKENEETI